MQEKHAVIIHGMWSQQQSMEQVEELFSALGFQAHLPLLPHHLPKDQMDTDAQRQLASCGIPEYQQHLQTYIDQLDGEVLLVGYSMGGLLAQLLAAKNTTVGLILLAPATPAGFNVWAWSVVKTLGKNLFKFPLWNTTTELGMANIVYGIANTQTAEIQQQILANSTYESGRASWQIANWYLYSKSPTAVSEQFVDCPILMICGGQDKIIPVSKQRKLAAKYTQTELYTIDEACHWLVSGSHFPKVQQRVKQWLKQHNIGGVINESVA